MVKLNRIIYTWPGVSAHWLGVSRSWFERFGWGGRQVNKPISTTSQLICRVVSATGTWFLRLTCTSKMGRGILEYSSDLVRMAVVGSLTSDSKCFFHELIQSLHRMVELCRRFSEVFYVKIA